MLTVAWYRFRATFPHRWGGYVAIALLIGLVGGLAMGSIAGARRTQSSYPTFLASTNTSTVTISVGSNSGAPLAFSPALTAEIARLPGVRRVSSLITPTLAPLAPSGAPDLSGKLSNSIQFVGSTDGMFLDQDRVSVVEGRAANANRVEEAVMTASAAESAGLHIGQVIRMGYYSAAQLSSPAFGTARVPPALRVSLKLVGIGVINRQVVQDDVDRTSGFVVLTPALLRAAVAVSPGGHVELPPGAPVLYGVQLGHGDRDVAGFEKAFARIAPTNASYLFNPTSRVVSEVELSVKPESVAFGAFGVIAALVALVIGTQAISRQFRVDDEDRTVLRALGARPVATAGDSLIGVLAAVVLGALLAVAVAVGLSPLAPLGRVRPVYPDRGIALDWTVLGIGLAVLIGVLGAVAIALALLRAPHPVAGKSPRAVPGRARLVRGAESAGLPISGVIGVRFALESGRGRTSVPVRSALVGTVLAVAVVVSSLTFASGLSTLVSHPALYGWNWNYMINTTNDVPPQSIKLLDHDPDVAAWAGAAIVPVLIGGQYVPTLFARTGATVAPPILSGHGLDDKEQIVLGSATLALLHTHVGATVDVSVGTAKDAPVYIPPTPLRVVGTATFPAIGYSSIVADHPSMGTGAMLSSGIEPPAWVRASTSSDPNLNGPQYVFVRLRPGVSAAAGLAGLRHIAQVGSKAIATDPNAAGNDTISVLGVQRPAQIVNYRSIGATPVVLAGGLALGAVVALGLTLTASVRRRRRDLALLRSLGFTQRQLSGAIASQSTVVACVGIVVGIPLGIVIGRQLWSLFARNINAVPDPTVPVLSVLLVALGALVFANVVAAIPERIAARTPTALVLRAE